MLPGSCSRQTLLFSATFPEDVKRLAAFAFCPDRPHQVVDAVGEQTNTNVQVRGGTGRTGGGGCVRGRGL